MNDSQSRSESLTTAFDNSKIIQKLTADRKLEKPLKIAFVDIDSTLTGQETITKKARAKLENLGYALVFVTARTEEMMMSKIQYEKSLRLGFSRPKPRIGIFSGKRVYVDPKYVNSNLVDPDIIIGSTGTQILVKQTIGGYLSDESFGKMQEKSYEWRENVLRFIKEIDPDNQFCLLDAIEDENNYHQRKTDIFPTAYRVKLNFKNVDGKIKFLEKLGKKDPFQSLSELKSTSFQNSTIRVIDDSHPEKEMFSIYITPVNVYKGSAVEHAVDMICKTLRKKIRTKVERGDLQVLLAGDSYPDLTMLLYGASGTKATAIVVGGSRLTRILTHESLHTYAGENMISLKKKLRLHVSKKGHYNFQTILKNDEIYVRNVIFGDQAFPQTKGPETILAFLNDKLKN